MRAVVNAVAVATGILISTSTYALQPLEPGQRLEPGQPTQLGQPPPGAMMRDSTINRHFGLFLRPDLGLGYMSTSQSNVTFSGAAGFFGFAIGGALSENFILAAHVYDGVVANPNVSVSGQSASSSNTTLGMFGIGPEITYYFMPSNIYISGTLAVTKLSLTVNNVAFNSDAGFGLKAAIGKEWWVGDHWGLGVAGAFNYSSNNDSGFPTISTWGLGIAFSATYN